MLIFIDGEPLKARLLLRGSTVLPKRIPDNERDRLTDGSRDGETQPSNGTKMVFLYGFRVALYTPATLLKTASDAMHCWYEKHCQ